MNLLTRIRETTGAWLAQGRIRETERRLGQAVDSYHYLRESLVDLADDLRSDGIWRRIAGQDEALEFNREARMQIMAEARAFRLKNPLIARGVELIAAYVFGQGVEVQHEDEEVNATVQAFWDAPSNRKAFTGQTALVASDEYLTTLGNQFWAAFTDPATGRVQLRMVPAPEIVDIICNPDDACEPWYYLRQWSDRANALYAKPEQRQALYPALFYEPAAQAASLNIGGQQVAVLWDSPVLHVRLGGLKDQQFGISGTYRAHDWARTDVKFLSDCSSFASSLARWAFKLTGTGGDRFLTAAKNRLASTFGVNPSTSASGGRETNPAPTAGAAFIATGDTKLEPVKIAGMGPDPEQGRTYRQYVATCFGFPETFFGNADVGNHATSKTLDRPFELTVLLRQALWREVIQTLLRYAIEKAATAPMGQLRGRLLGDVPGEGITLRGNSDTGKPVTTTVRVTFPPVLEHDITETVKAIVTAITLDGKQPAQWATGQEGILLVTRMLLAALGESNPDEILERLFPDGVVPEPPEPDTASVAGAVESLARRIQEARRGN